MGKMIIEKNIKPATRISFAGFFIPGSALLSKGFAQAHPGFYFKGEKCHIAI